MVKIGDKLNMDHLSKNGYTLRVHLGDSRIYDKRNHKENKATELFYYKDICELKYIYEILGNQIIKTLKVYGG